MPPPGSRQQVAEPQASQLRAQIAQLDAQAEAIRVKLAGETDRVKRYAYLDELKQIGDRKRPLDDLLHLGPQAPQMPVEEPGDAGA
jgi:predicted  nucleic acid-binding Zn-ribbon protein